MGRQGLTYVSGYIPVDDVARATERLGSSFGINNTTTLIRAALLAVSDERIPLEVLADACARAPRKRGRPARKVADEAA